MEKPVLEKWKPANGVKFYRFIFTGCKLYATEYFVLTTATIRHVEWVKGASSKSLYHVRLLFELLVIKKNTMKSRKIFCLLELPLGTGDVPLTQSKGRIDTKWHWLLRLEQESRNQAILFKKKMEWSFTVIIHKYHQWRRFHLRKKN